MTCKCPPRLCYYRPDCRHNKARSNTEFTRRATAHEAKTRAAVKVLGGDWLYERREALEAELAVEQAWTHAQRKAKRLALVLVEAAIERRSLNNAQEGAVVWGAVFDLVQPKSLARRPAIRSGNRRNAREAAGDVLRHGASRGDRNP